MQISRRCETFRSVENLDSTAFLRFSFLQSPRKKPFTAGCYQRFPQRHEPFVTIVPGNPMGFRGVLRFLKWNRLSILVAEIQNLWFEVRSW